MITPLLSVCIITYNHKNYISKAIDSALNQITSFDYQIIIADDCSNDGTREILLAFKEKYPEKIELILQEKNIGPAKNWMDLLSSASSKYISYFEGDDYWLDMHKLQKQIDFLESNNDCGLVYSKSSIEIEGIIKDQTIGSGYQFFNLFEFNLIPTLTVMFRSEHFISFKMKFYKKIVTWKIGDYPLWIWISLNSKIHFLESTTAVHRVVTGSESNKGNRYLINLEAFEISKFFLENFSINENLKTYFIRRLFLLAVCFKNKPKYFFKLLIKIW